MKALDVLEALQHADEMTLAEIVERTGMPKSSCYRIIQTLESRGYVERGQDEKRYRLTFQLVEMTKRLLQQNPIRRSALPHMYRLADQFGETVNLGVLQGAEVLYVETLESRHPFRVTETAGARSPVYVTGLGKALAAHLSPGELDSLLSLQSWRAVTPRTIVDRERFMEALEQVRRCGYALDDEEAETGVRCIAAPILGPEGYPLAAISISAPAARIAPSEVEPLARELCVACRSISAEIRNRRRP